MRDGNFLWGKRDGRKVNEFNLLQSFDCLFSFIPIHN